MTTKQYDFLMKYYRELENEIEIFNASMWLDDNENGIYDMITNISHIFNKELPEIHDCLKWEKGAGISDAQVVMGLIEKYIIDSGYVANSPVEDQITKFGVSFKMFLEKRILDFNFLKEEFTHWDNWNGGSEYVTIDYKEEYKLFYGIDYAEDIKTINDIKLLVEITYNNWIKTEKRYEFTKYINERLSFFRLPCRLENGKLINKGYKTTNYINSFINKERLENRIAYAEENILSNNILDKQSALESIVGGLQFLISIQKGKGAEQRKSTAKLVSDGKDDKVYIATLNEIDCVMKMINEYFVVRHHEFKNTQKEVREVLIDSQYIEYLYNRIYSLLYIIKNKHIGSNNTK